MKKLFLSLVICLINCINPAISYADNIIAHDIELLPELI